MNTLAVLGIENIKQEWAQTVLNVLLLVAAVLYLALIFFGIGYALGRAFL